MKKELVRDLAITGGIYDCLRDPYDKLGNGDYYSSVMVDLERFAELIVAECIQAIQNESKDPMDELEYGLRVAEGAILDHFGVEE